MKRSILMLEPDDDDRYITQAVIDENSYNIKIEFVNNSDDLFSFLFSCEKNFLPFPSLILLTHYASPLNAVGILKALKGNPGYAAIPVVVLSGAMNDEIIRDCYASGANSFIKKPSSAQEINEKIGSFIRYWFKTVELR